MTFYLVAIGRIVEHAVLKLCMCSEYSASVSSTTECNVDTVTLSECPSWQAFSSHLGKGSEFTHEILSIERTRENTDVDRRLHVCSANWTSPVSIRSDCITVKITEAIFVIFYKTLAIRVTSGSVWHRLPTDIMLRHAVANPYATDSRNHVRFI